MDIGKLIQKYRYIGRVIRNVDHSVDNYAQLNIEKDKNIEKERERET